MRVGCGGEAVRSDDEAEGKRRPQRQPGGGQLYTGDALMRSRSSSRTAVSSNGGRVARCWNTTSTEPVTGLIAQGQ